jgi:hypothetical protein
MAVWFCKWFCEAVCSGEISLASTTDTGQQINTDSYMLSCCVTVDLEYDVVSVQQK